MKKNFQDLQEKLIQDNLKIKKELKMLIEQNLKENFYNLKQEMNSAKKEKKSKIFKIKLKTGLVTFLVGLLLSAIWLITRK